MDFLYSPYFYATSVILQIICAVHCVKRGTQQKWLWIIIIVPLAGSIAYIFSEMSIRNNLSNVQSGVAGVVNPGGRIKKLEEQLKFADTFNNRIMLADAYLAAGMMEQAASIYETSLVGAFDENEHGIMQLMLAYYQMGRFDEVIRLGKKVYRQPQFTRSRAHLYYVLSLEKTGKADAAEAEFKMICGKFANYENRYEYGLFLARNGKPELAEEVFNVILHEKDYLSSRERNMNRKWFGAAKDALRKLKEVA